MTLRARIAALAVTALTAQASATSVARADSVWEEFEIEVPVLMLDPDGASDEADDSSELDLANVVTSAARAVTTVQEAPAIVTVITDEQLANRNTRDIEQALDFVPGWMRYGANHSQFPYTMTRGIFQATLLMRDGVSLFDPMINVASFNRSIPIESIKRIEVITGPAGVLWGANSFLGLVNVITKTGGDVEGVQGSFGYGTGAGSTNNLRGYVMAGASDALVEDLDVFAHASFEGYESPHFTMPSFLYHSAQPQPNSLLLYGPLDTADPARSSAFNLALNAQYEHWDLRLQLPWIHENKSLSFAGALVNEHLEQDDLPECQSIPPGGDIADPPCIDRGKVGRRSQFQFYERLAAIQYEDRVGGDVGVGVRARGYGVQFVRRWTPLLALVPVATVLPGGLSFETDVTTYRVGANVDGDFSFGMARGLVGVETFREWLPDNVTRSRSGAGAEARFPGPYDLSLLPLPCPQTARWDAEARQAVDAELIDGCPLTFAFATHRTVMGAYSALHWEPTRRLILDGGVRVQAAPESLSKRGYDPQLLASATAVYNFWKNWHTKLNYTQGFRSPVFNNTDSNGEAVSLPGSPDLDPERSEAYQIEVNARIPMTRRVRELTFRTDYSLTRLENLISFPRGQYINGGDRELHSAELLAQIAISGGHRFELGYTWLRIRAEDVGELASMPEHWFTLGAVTSLTSSLQLTGSLRVVSAFQDPNRLVEYRGLEFGDNGSISPDPASGQSVVVQPYELVFDRIPPGAELNAGLRWTSMKGRLVVDGVLYNAFDTLRYQPDGTSSFSPRLDILPNPYARFSFFLSAAYRVGI